MTDIVMSDSRFHVLVEQIIGVLRPDLYDLDADKGDDCMPYAKAYDAIEFILNMNEIFNEATYTCRKGSDYDDDDDA